MISYQVETFIWLSLGVILIALRLGVRVWLLGSVRSWRIDDYLMMLVAILFTTESLLSFFIYDLGTGNVEESVRKNLTNEDIRQRQLGAKLLYAGWFVYFLLLWSLKWAMIEFYKRLNLGKNVAICLRVLSWLVALSALGILFTLIFTCWPISHNWQVVPDPGVKCTEDWAYFAVTGLPNILTEFALLIIPITVLFRVHISLRHKITLSILFGLGGVIIVITAFRHVSIFRDIYNSKLIIIWGTREAFASIFVGNAPQLKPLYDLCYDKITGRVPSEMSYLEGEDIGGDGDRESEAGERPETQESRDLEKGKEESRPNTAVSQGHTPTPVAPVSVPLPPYLSLHIRPFSPLVIMQPGFNGSNENLVIHKTTSLDVSFSKSSPSPVLPSAPVGNIAKMISSLQEEELARAGTAEGTLGHMVDHEFSKFRFFDSRTPSTRSLRRPASVVRT